MKTLIKTISFFFLGLVLTGFIGFIGNDIIPKGWHKAGNNPNGFRIGIENQFAKHGLKCAYIESIDKQPTGFCTLMQTFIDNDYSNKRIKMTGYVKTEGKIDTAQMWVRIDDFDKRIMDDFDNMDNRRIIGTNDWQKCEIIFDVPPSNYTINFGVFLHGTGKIWVDNISFDIVDKSTIKTAHSSKKPIPPNFIIKENTGKALNLDFED